MNKVCLFQEFGPAQTIELEYAFFSPEHSANPSSQTIVLLHEGLGCVQMWRNFPQLLADSTKLRVLAYSREGYGSSTPISGPRDIEFMRDEAVRVLPALLNALEIENPILIGHSDGASIALLAAAVQKNIVATIVLAPHLFVENICVTAITETLATYKEEAKQMRTKLAKFHTDVDGAFYGWANVWLSEQFLHWNIEADIAPITCPLLAIQGEQDQYGTMKQLDQLKVKVPHAQLLKLDNCRHSPQFDQTEKVLTAISQFIVLQMRVLAALHGRSTEAEVREILALAVTPETRVRLGDALSELGRKSGLSN
jgi:pimeloyl-ACP methyl ester carboxylesterase